MSKRIASKAKNGISRRAFVAGTTSLAAAGAVTGFPNIVQAADPVRSVGLGVSIINEIQGKASKDLGFPVRGQALGYGAMFGKMLNQNDQYDVAEGYYNDMDVMWPSKVWQPIDTQRVKDWDKVSNLCKTGKLTEDSKVGQGDAPVHHLWVDENGSKTKGPSRYVSMVPGWHNADSIGYNPDETGRKIESWAELFHPDFKGRMALLNVPQVGTMDAALGVEALGIFKFKDKGDMTREEIDFLIDFLIKKKQEGHFRAFWETFGQSVNLMVNGEVALGKHVVAGGDRDQGRRRQMRLCEPERGHARLARRLVDFREGGRQGARSGLRVHQLVARRLGRGLRGTPGLLHVGARQCEETPGTRGMGFLVHGQAGGQGTAGSVWNHHRREGRGA